MPFDRCIYEDLKPKQQENYNFQKISAILADYGFVTIRLSDDWEGADFLARHVDGNTILKVQLKGRFSFDKKYLGKNLWICFRIGNVAYLYPHDETLAKAEEISAGFTETEAWRINGAHNWPSVPKHFLTLLEMHILKSV